MNGNSHSLLRAIRGPIMLIAIGVLFAADQFTDYGIWRTWPVLLILLGVLKLAERIGSGAQTPPGGGM
jgi:hypothetical protein